MPGTIMRSLVGLAVAALVATALPAAAQQPEPQQPQPQEQQREPQPQQPRPGMQPGMGMRMPMYDTATESTFTGTVQSVEEVTGQGRMGGGMSGMSGMSGTHIVLKTDSGTLPVHLGPSSYLAEKNIRLEEGDEIEVVGSRARMGSDEFVIARQVKRGDDEWTFRDQSGRPLWRMGRMQ
jgi:hypothetical protein